MMYKAKVTVCSEIHTKHSTRTDYHVEFLNVKGGGAPIPVAARSKA